MAKRRRVRVGRVILLVIIGVALVLVGVFACKYLFSLKDKEETVEIKETVTEEKKQSSLKIDLVDYECYRNELFDFDFLIARIRFKDEKKISYSLSDISTDEGIQLSDYRNYTEELSKENYYLSMKNVSYEIESDENSLIVSLFVPYKSGKGVVTLYFKDGEEISIDTTKNLKDMETLKYENGSFIEKENYEIYVSNAFVADVVFENGQLYEVPSSQKIYTFELTVNSISNGVTLTEAKYINSKGKEYESLSSAFTSNEVSLNMMDAVIEKGKSYGLYFKVVSPDSEPIVYDGTLMLKFSDSDDYIEISAKFE